MRRHAGGVSLEVRIPAENERGPAFQEQALAALHAANPRRLSIGLALRRANGKTSLLVDVPDMLRHAVEHQLHAAYPDADLRPLTDADGTTGAWHSTLRLSPDWRLAKTYDAAGQRALSATAVDPLAAVLLALPSQQANTSARVDLSLTPVAAKVAARLRRFATLRANTRLSGRAWRRRCYG